MAHKQLVYPGGLWNEDYLREATTAMKITLIKEHLLIMGACVRKPASAGGCSVAGRWRELGW